MVELVRFVERTIRPTGQKVGIVHPLALEAMQQSFFGCLKNVLPFLLYGVILFIASVIASIPVLLGWLILGPVLAASVYTAYRDIYFTE